jgi:hypothetical protein
MLKSLQTVYLRSIVAAVALLTLSSPPSVAQNLDAFAPPVDPDGDLDSPGGGTRGGGCYQLETEQSTPLMAFSPIDTQLARTQEARPKFRALVAPTDAQYGIFTLQDEEGYVHYRGEMIALPEKGGMVTIALPSDVELVPTKTYRWFLELLCSGSIDPNNPIAEGQIQRVLETPTNSMASLTASSTTSPIATLNLETDDVTTILSRVEFYQQSQLWYEAIETLATARLSHPDDDRLKDSWDALLELAGITTETYNIQ